MRQGGRGLQSPRWPLTAKKPALALGAAVLRKGEAWTSPGMSSFLLLLSPGVPWWDITPLPSIRQYPHLWLRIRRSCFLVFLLSHGWYLRAPRSLISFAGTFQHRTPPRPPSQVAFYTTAPSCSLTSFVVYLCLFCFSHISFFFISTDGKLNYVPL